MIVYRLCNEIYSNDLSGTGAKMFGGRWNSKGIPMLYSSEHISLATLEMIVHNHFKDFAVELALVKIALPTGIELQEIKAQKLKEDWIEDASYTRFMGNQFVQSGDQLAIKVPSVIITEEFNILINPLHKDFKKVKITAIKNFRTDKRLVSI
jgi:RES domain-containing protein